MGLDPHETTIAYSAFLERIHPDDRSLVATIHETLDSAGYYESRHRIMLPDGSIRSIQSRGRLIPPTPGGLKEYVGTMVDITEQLRLTQQLRVSLDEKDSLLKEVHHRVKNNLQLISSMLNLQASRMGDQSVSELFAESRNRVRSMALVHENLYHAGNFSKISIENHIETLSISLIRAYGLISENIELRTDVEDILLGIDTAISIGLIVNELVSNALKHAFRVGFPGSIKVQLTRSSGDHCILVVADNGIGLPCHVDPNNAKSMGLQLVHDLAQQLNGTVSVKRIGGTAFMISFVIAQPTGDAQ
jgi:two-component sensor histidine kinase